MTVIVLRLAHLQIVLPPHLGSLTSQVCDGMEHPTRILPLNYPAVHVEVDNKFKYILNLNRLDLLPKHKFARYFPREQQSLDLFLGCQD